MKKLRAPAGADGANVGTKLFPLDADGNVTVPDEDVQTLVGVGGFEIVGDIPDAPEGHTVMLSLSGAQSCSFGDNSYTTDEKGFVTVPTAMVGDLLSHGFVLAPQADAKVEEEQPAPEPVQVEPAALMPAAEPAAPVAEPAPTEVKPSE